ncbi:IS701 family transposase [Kitasatospora sp. LaBMicrA B282]|uniref:IS701 family transposase n=1 Tax=Kitasatospora sp. LaBMicrA B282 TaxID=3420949 RepID=UPI003D12733B
MISNLRAPQAGLRQDGISAYCQELFASFARSDQRRWGEVYLRGLLHATGRKTPANISEQVLGRRAVQPIQQFVNQSTWAVGDVRRRLAELVCDAAAPQAWAFHDVVFPKNGTRSAGVARQFVPAEGRIMNCQLAMTTSLVHAGGSQPVNWQLLMPRRWDADEELRGQAHVPADARYLPRWRYVLDSLDQMLEDWDVPSAPVLADWSFEKEVEPLLLGLEERGLSYLVEVGGSTTLPACTTGAHRVLPVGHHGHVPARGPVTVRRRAADLADALGEQGERAVLAWRDGPTTRSRHSQFLVVPLSVGLPGRRGRFADVLPPAQRHLVVEWPFGRSQPRTYWVTNQPVHRLGDLVAQAELRGRAVDDCERLHREYGLTDFEGRSFRGWHHHVTLVSAAFGFDLLHGMEAMAQLTAEQLSPALG